MTGTGGTRVSESVCAKMESAALLSGLAARLGISPKRSRGQGSLFVYSCGLEASP